MNNKLVLPGAALAAFSLLLGRVSADVTQVVYPNDGNGVSVNSNNRTVDRAGSPLYFGGPSDANAVFIGGTPILRVRVGADGYTADQRASAIQERLNLLLGEGPITPDEITTSMVGPDAVVLVKGQLLFTADTATAHINSTTTMDLANVWADHVRKVLPGLTEAK